MSFRALKLKNMVPTHVQLVKQLSHDGSHYKYSLSLLNRSYNTQQFDDQTYNYLKEYSHYNFNSNYKSWFELTPKEKNKFMDSYVRLHERTIPSDHKNSLKNCINDMYNKNKDFNFVFAYLYQNLKDNADKEMSAQEEFEVEDAVVLEKDDEAESLLFKKF